MRSVITVEKTSQVFSYTVTLHEEVPFLDGSIFLPSLPTLEVFMTKRGARRYARRLAKRTGVRTIIGFKDGVSAWVWLDFRNNDLVDWVEEVGSDVA